MYGDPHQTEHVVRMEPVPLSGALSFFIPSDVFRFSILTPGQQHIKSCTSCLGALKKADRCMSAAKATAVASFAWVRVYLNRAQWTLDRGFHSVNPFYC